MLHLEKTEEATAKEQVQTHTRTHAPAALSLVVGDDLVEAQRHAGDGVGHGVRDLDLAHLPLFEPILLGRRKRQLEENMACMPSISL